ncbi:hypothetical protein HI914_04820 [Erysiphe necator]|nr:hypothetical protein HI914_04820 [Erysiphe necator]
MLTNEFATKKLHNYVTETWDQSDLDDKYSGHPNESFDSKFKTFEIYCTRAVIPNEKKNKTFDMILKGSGLEYYRTLCNYSSSIPDIEFLKRSIDAFQGKEHKLATLTQWNEFTLQQIVDKRDDKDVEAALNSLIVTLPCSQDHESLTSLIASLQARVATWKAKQPRDPQYFYREASHEYSNQRLFTDRTYHIGNSRNRGQTNNNGYLTGSRQGGHYSKFRPKTCFVCRKTNCWSSRHSDNERLEAR